MIVEAPSSSSASDGSLLEDWVWEEPRAPVAAFLALLCFLVVLIVRPAEIVPALAVLRLALTTFCLALALWLMSGRPAILLQPMTSRCVLALLVCMVISVPFSVWPTRSLDELVIFAKQATVFLLIVNVVQSTQSVSRLLAVLVWALSIHAVVVIKRYLAGEVYLDRVFGIAGGSFSDPNDLALAFVMMFPVALQLASRSRGLTRRCVWLLFAILFPAAIVATQSRGGMLGLCGASGALLLESRRKFTVLATLAVCGLVIWIVTPTAFERYESIKDYRQDESASTRLTVWRAGLQMWSDHPLTGVGVGAFSVAYGETYRDPSFPVAVWYDAHSSPIKVMAELGTPGLVAWCAMVGAGLMGLYRHRRPLRHLARETDSPSVMDLALTCQTLRASLVGYLICCLFLSRSYDWMLMLFLALAVSCTRLARMYMQEYTGSWWNTVELGVDAQGESPLVDQ